MITKSRTAASAASLSAAPAAIFALLGLIDIALLGVVGSAVAPPPGVSIIVAGLGLVTLVALIPARHGSQRALVTAVAARLISALLAAAAFFADVLGLGHGRGSLCHRRDRRRARPAASAAPAAGSLTMARIRLILVGAVLGLTWAAALRGYMMQLACLTSTFTFSGTFGIILPTGTLVGALLGWAEYQRRAGRWYPLLIGAPLLLTILPSLLTAGLDLAPVGLALSAMVGGYAVSGRGPLWVRSVAGLIAVRAIVAPFAAPKPYPDLSVTTPYGAWAATLASSLFVALALACSIPMRAPDPIQAPGESRSARPDLNPGQSLTERA